MSPVQIQLLLTTYYNPGPLIHSDEAERKAIRHLVTCNLIDSNNHEITERGKVLVDKYVSIPLPVERKTWVFIDEVRP